MKLVQDSKARTLIEIMLVAGTFLLMRWLFQPVKYSSQIAEVFILILITILFRRNGTTWKEIGLTFPKRWLMALMYAILCVITIG
ncbi:MAG: hypothetical protein RIA63_07225, partial [Cyclobacteriaceae bacterium]